MRAWAWFAVVQLVSIAATVLGWAVLIPFCLLQAWTAPVCLSNKPWPSGMPDLGPARVLIDRWRFKPLNWIYGNPEDGVSGRQAYIWATPSAPALYMPGAWAPWRAYLWSAWRNSADNLKYVFAWKEGPYWAVQIGGRWLQAGWHLQNGVNVPVLGVIK